MKKTVVVDLDGTVANCDTRLHHVKGKKRNYKAFYSEVANDKPINDMIELVKSLSFLYEIVFCTGRSEISRYDTIQWINQHMGMDTPVLLMRNERDYRPDNETKLELLENYGLTPHEVLFILEDRSRVVKAWRDAGYRCLQVQEGDY